jgi:TPR repeat protein
MPMMVTAQDFQKGLEAYESGDYAAALQEWKPLAEQGDATAQNNLGVMYENGDGVPQDDAEAVNWFRLAAEQGLADAQSNLGIMYEYGKGVLQDNVMAHMWYNIASANGNEDAGKWRDERAGLMTPADISKAQAMARECMSGGYQNCGQ